MDKNEDKGIKLGSILVVAILLGIIGFAGYATYDAWKKNKEIEEAIVHNDPQTVLKLEDLPDGYTYIYSEEQKAELREQALKIQEKDIKKYDLFPGLPQYIAFILRTDEERASDDFTDWMKNRDGKMHDSYFAEENIDHIYDIETTDDLGTVFNDDLSLKLIRPFIGFTSVGEDELEYAGGYNYFKERLEEYDSKYAYSENGLYKQLKQIVDHSDESLAYANVTEIGITSIYRSMFDEKTKYIHPFVSITRYGIPYDVFEDGSPANYEEILNKYNYYNTNNSYYTTYVPSKVTKVNWNTYIVDLETDKPIDIFASSTAINMIGHYFTPCLYYVPETGKWCVRELRDNSLNLIVRINYEGDAAKELFPAAYSNITSEYLGDDFTYDLAEFNVGLWYPNEESQEWYDRFYSKLSEAYENEEPFPIFDEIKAMSEEYGVDYKTMEIVVLYRWREIFYKKHGT